MAFMRAAEPRLFYSLGFTIALSLVGCGHPDDLPGPGRWIVTPLGATK